jgi:hypothetical protein
MTGILIGDELKVAIEKILAEDNGSYAVAFWGAGAAKKLPQNGKGEFRAICNLTSGGTNPSEIKKLKRQNIRQCDTLHAKVYIGSERAVIASANISANGLGFEGVEQARWIEAGTSIQDTSACLEWFETQWKNAREISDADIKKAEMVWGRRRRSRPTVLSIDDFNPLSEQLPLLYWFGNTEYKVDKEAAKQHNVAVNDIEGSLVCEGDGIEDGSALQPGSWVVVWNASEVGVPKKNANPYWFYTGRMIPKAIKYKGWRQKQDVVIESDNSPSEPFMFNKNLAKIFYDVLGNQKFDELRSTTYENGWFTTDRMFLMRDFWVEFKQEYSSRKVA